MTTDDPLQLSTWNLVWWDVTNMSTFLYETLSVYVYWKIWTWWHRKLLWSCLWKKQTV